MSDKPPVPQAAPQSDDGEPRRKGLNGTTRHHSTRKPPWMTPVTEKAPPLSPNPVRHPLEKTS